MFANFTRRFGRIALGAAILPAALLAAGAGRLPDRDGWGRHDHDSGWHGGVNVGVVIGGWPRPVIVAQPPVIISQPAVVRAYADVIPSTLGFSAYQSRDTIILVASGSNRGSGISTAFTSVDCYTGKPVVTMRNTPSCEVDGRLTVPFSLTASIRSTTCVNSLQVRVAGQAYEVPVVQVPSLT